MTFSQTDTGSDAPHTSSSAAPHAAAPDAPLDVLIVGGGFAGLAAALRLEQAGAKIALIEKRPFFGGRAYSFRENKSGDSVDNGQHLLMGAYHETFAFLQSLGTLDRLHFQAGLEVSFADPQRGLQHFRCSNLPAPFHLAGGLLNYPGLGLADKWAMTRLMRFCKKNIPTAQLDAMTTHELMQRTRQRSDAVKGFWEPLVLATINESLEKANAGLFLEVLRQGLLGDKQDSRLVFPRVGFDELYTQPAQDYLQHKNVPIFFQSQVSRLERSGTHWIAHSTSGQKIHCDSILFAVPPDALEKILQNSSPELRQALPQLAPLTSSPIVSVNLWYDGFRPDFTMLGLLDSPIHWMFSKAQLVKNADYISLVVSGAYALALMNKKQLVDLAQAELQRFFPQLAETRLYHSQVIKELQATYGGTTNTKEFRPAAVTALPGLYLAGDWTDTGLPATIESAVRSGHRAAAAIEVKSA